MRHLRELTTGEPLVAMHEKGMYDRSRGSP